MICAQVRLGDSELPGPTRPGYKLRAAGFAVSYRVDMPKTPDVADYWVNTTKGQCKDLYIKRDSGEYWRSQDDKLQYCRNPYPRDN